MDNYKILGNKGIILIKFDRNLVNPIDKYGNNEVWKYNMDNINRYLDTNNIPREYVGSGDIIVTKRRFPKRILLIHKSLAKYPIDYIQTDKFNEGIIWEPITDSGYKSLGMIYSKNKPKLTSLGLVNIEYLKRIKEGPYITLAGLNEYNHISNTSYGFWTLTKPTDNLKNDIEYMNPNTYDILDNEGNYITYENNKIIFNKTKPNNATSKFPKELEINNRKYKFENNRFRNENTCLAKEGDNIIIKQCSMNDKNQNFYLNDKGWHNIKGKYVTLVENPNPWWQRFNTPQVNINNSNILNNNLVENNVNCMINNTSNYKFYILLSIIILIILLVIIKIRLNKSV